MSEILLQIDGKEVKATKEMTIFEAAQSAGIHIPTVCHNEKLEPYGACRICTVEAEVRGRTILIPACVYPVEENLVITTRSEKVDRTRKMILELMLAHAPDSELLKDLAQEYGADPNRFEKDPSFCILCGLCVRYCAEIKKKNAVGFVDRGPRREISFVPEIASKECWDCKECFPLCPTSYAQAAYALTEALAAFPQHSSKPASGDKVFKA
jgi:bidirectional [NiFe] hydrogenase diaphorase subunit